MIDSSAPGTTKAKVEPTEPVTRRGENFPSPEPLRAIIERLPDGIVIVDKAGNIRFANPAAQRLFGRRAPDLLGTQFGFPLVVGETTEIDIVQRGGADS